MSTCPVCAASLEDDDARRKHEKWHNQLRNAMRDVLIAANLGHRGLIGDPTKI